MVAHYAGLPVEAQIAVGRAYDACIARLRLARCSFPCTYPVPALALIRRSAFEICRRFLSNDDFGESGMLRALDDARRVNPKLWSCLSFFVLRELAHHGEHFPEDAERVLKVASDLFLGGWLSRETDRALEGDSVGGCSTCASRFWRRAR
jgi:hypothetical protein